LPGLFGIIGTDPSIVSSFVERWLQTWPQSVLHRAPGGVIGAHGFEGSAAVRMLADGTALAVDGDTSAYEGVPEDGGELPPGIGRYDGRSLVLAQSFRGNAALLSPDGNEVRLSTEWTGTFPVFTWWNTDIFAFSSLLGPLVALTPRALDPVGLSQYLTHAHTCGGRSVVRGVRRLLPGQALRFQRGAAPEVLERSTLWAEDPETETPLPRIASQLYPSLSNAVNRGVTDVETCSLMMSAGWDSRLLLAAMHGNWGASKVQTLSHGDTGGRELRLARTISTESGSRHLEREITGSVLDHSALAKSFERCGTALFPHWVESSAELQNGGRTTVFSGVYGEILGGHYGETMVRRGPRKVGSLLRALLQTSPPPQDGEGELTRAELSALLGATPRVTRWYLNRDWVKSCEDLPSRVLDSVNRDINRLEQRGVMSQQRLIEAFVSEHRGSQYINAQALSARAHGNVSLPFIDRGLLQATLKTPLHLRLQNKLNRELLVQYAPHLLKYPMAATLVSARRPILVQELSRSMRMAGELVRSGLYHGSGRRIPKTRLGWANFGFMADSGILTEAVSSLSLDIWNKGRLLEAARKVEKGTWRGRLHPLFDQLGKIFTVDLALRRRP
jgi:hypothetical protein